MYIKSIYKICAWRPMAKEGQFFQNWIIYDILTGRESVKCDGRPRI